MSSVELFDIEEWSLYDVFFPDQSNSSYSVVPYSFYYWYTDPVPSRVSYACTVTILGVLALVSNILFLFTVKHPALRTSPTVVYLVILSLIDIATILSFLIQLICMTPRFFYQFLDWWNWCEYLIRIPGQILSYILILAVARDRFKAICRPMSTVGSSLNIKKRFFVTSGVLLVVWAAVATFVVHVPTYVHTLYVNNALIAIDVIVVLVTVVLYSLVYRTLRRSRRRSIKMCAIESRNRYRDEMNITRMLTVNTVVFIALVLVQDTIIHYYHLVDPSGRFFFWPNSILALINSGINPIIYNMFGSRYREAFSKTYFCSKYFQRERSSVQITMESHINEV